LNSASVPLGWNFADCGLRWTRNLGHNLIREINLSFNDLVAERMDSFFLDFWSAFTMPGNKRNGYNNMIGNIAELTNPRSISTVPANYQSLPTYVLNIPVPFFYSRDSGISLPTAAIPYNDMVHYVTFRDVNELLIVDNYALKLSTSCQRVNLTNSNPLVNCDMWAEYAIVSNVERAQMGKAPRDILMEQVQTAPKQTFDPNLSQSPNYDIRFSHAVKVLFFAAYNTTTKSEGSNYGTVSPFVKITTNGPLVDFYGNHGIADPIENTSLIYENTTRLAQMGSDYYSLVNPFFHAPVIPIAVGYHTYSYSLDFISLDPMGSTNYGKLTNVSIVPTASAAAVSAANPTINSDYLGTPTTQADSNVIKQKYSFIVTAVNNNIIRISGGALGFPVL
jgi:hypothetical protein